MKWLGVAYLAFLGVMMLRSAGRITQPADGDTGGAAGGRALFLRSFLVAITNPKGYLFVSAFLPQFVAPRRRNGRNGRNTRPWRWCSR